MNKKMVFASDYDNTLFIHKLIGGGVSRKNMRKIREFQASGGLFGLCTGRPHKGFFFDPAIKRLRIDFFIVSTGAHILSGDNNVLYEKSIPFDTAKDVFESERSSGHSIQMDGDFYLIKPAVGKASLLRASHSLNSIDEAKGHTIYEISFRLKNEELAAEATVRINENFSDVVTAYQNVKDIDVVSKGCSKGNGACFIKEYFNADLIGGMGDSLNDLSLIQAVDFGYTFASAPYALKSAAYDTHPDVAAAIDSFMMQSL